MPASKPSAVLASGGRAQIKGKPPTPNTGAAGVKSSQQAKISARAPPPQSHQNAQALSYAAEAKAAAATVAAVTASASASVSVPAPVQPTRSHSPQPPLPQSQLQSYSPQPPALSESGELQKSPSGAITRKRERPDPADMKAAGLAANANQSKFNESLGVVSTLAGEHAYRKTATSVSRETYQKLDAKPALPFKARASALKDPIAHTDATISNPNFNPSERAALEKERLRSESSRYFVDHYQLHASEVHAGRGIKPAAILASQAVRVSGPFEGKTVSQDAFVNFMKEHKERGEVFEPPKSFKPPPQKLDLVKEDRKFYSEQREQQAKTQDLAKNSAVNVLVKNSVSLKNFRGTGAAAAMGFGSSGMSEQKTVSQAAFSKFTRQQQLNAKAREPTVVSSPNAKPQRNPNQPPNSDFAHVKYGDDAPLRAPPAGQSSGAPPPAPEPIAAAASASAAAPSASASPPRAGVASARAGGGGGGGGTGRAANPTTAKAVQSKAGYNIINALSPNEQKKWSAQHNQSQQSVAASSFTHDGGVYAAKSFKPVNANASSVTINGTADPAHASSQWASEGQRAFNGVQQSAADGNISGVAARGKSGSAALKQQSSGVVAHTAFEGRSTAADSYGARPKAGARPTGNKK